MRYFLALLLIALPAAASADDTAFARVAEYEDGKPRALQVAVASYVPRTRGRSIQVDLVSAIHIGDAAYYHELNRRFESYDVLLYELVAPKGASIAERDGKHRGFVSGTQMMMKNMLELSFQLDEIDYSASNFVHADLSPTELSESMDERGESLYVYFWRVFYASINQYAKDPLGIRDMQKLSAAMASGSENSFKVMLAYEMTDLDNLREILGDDADSAVIGARNQRAIDELKSALKLGHRRVAIFYGVAHMPDLEARLVDQLDLVRLDTDWVDAWRLDDQADQ